MPAAELPLDAIKALVALNMGYEFAVFDEGKMGVQVNPETWIEITEDDLCHLTDRALIRISEDDNPESGLPKTIVVTRLGRDWLKRYEAANGVKIKLNPNPVL